MIYTDSKTPSHSGTYAARPNRRAVVKALVGIGVAAVAAGPTLGLLSPASARSTDSLIVNTAGARLRSGPGTGYATIASLAKGAEVRYLADGGTANGYRWYKVRVLSTGKEGFVAASLLSAPDGGSDPVIIGIMYTTATVNLRSGPSTSNSVLKVVPANSAVQASDTARNGYRYVIISGLAGWISESYLAHRDAPSEGTFTTTARLNLRAQPSSTAAVILTMPENSVVTALAGTAPGWRQVSYKGTVGWASTNYLN
ncbi:MAG TPA: SH3 domain-containing protein [Thermomicrobiales bacterium]|nr:SH3 domain-containing protein [Thermomicrobiales bacterium]